MYKYTVAIIGAEGQVIDWFGTNEAAEVSPMEDTFVDRLQYGEKVVLKEGDKVLRDITY